MKLILFALFAISELQPRTAGASKLRYGETKMSYKAKFYIEAEDRQLRLRWQFHILSIDIVRFVHEKITKSLRREIFSIMFMYRSLSCLAGCGIHLCDRFVLWK